MGFGSFFKKFGNFVNTSLGWATTALTYVAGAVALMTGNVVLGYTLIAVATVATVAGEYDAVTDIEGLQQKSGNLSYNDNQHTINVRGKIDETIPVIYGKNRVGGNLVFAKVTGDNNEWLNYVYSIGEGIVELDYVNFFSKDGLYLNDVKYVNYVSSFNKVDGKIVSGLNFDYNGKLWLTFYKPKDKEIKSVEFEIKVKYEGYVDWDTNTATGSGNLLEGYKTINIVINNNSSGSNNYYFDEVYSNGSLTTENKMSQYYTVTGSSVEYNIKIDWNFYLTDYYVLEILFKENILSLYGTLPDYAPYVNKYIINVKVKKIVFSDNSEIDMNKLSLYSENIAQVQGSNPVISFKDIDIIYFNSVEFFVPISLGAEAEDVNSSTMYYLEKEVNTSAFPYGMPFTYFNDIQHSNFMYDSNAYTNVGKLYRNDVSLLFLAFKYDTDFFTSVPQCNIVVKGKLTESKFVKIDYNTYKNKYDYFKTNIYNKNDDFANENELKPNISFRPPFYVDSDLYTDIDASTILTKANLSVDNYELNCYHYISESSVYQYDTDYISGLNKFYDLSSRIEKKRFKTIVTPIEALYDYLTNNVYGMKLTNDDLDVELFKDGIYEEIIGGSWKFANDYCVKYGFNYSAVIKGQRIDDIINDMLKHCKGILYLKEGKFFIKICDLYVEHALGMFYPVNIIYDTQYFSNFSYIKPDITSKYDTCKVTFVDENNNFKSNSIYYPYELYEITNTPNILNLNLATTNEDRAKQFAYYYFVKANNSSKISFIAPLDYADLEVGQVFDFTYEDVGIKNKLFRVTTIKPDYNGKLYIEAIEEGFDRYSKFEHIAKSNYRVPDLYANTK